MGCLMQTWAPSSDKRGERLYVTRQLTSLDLSVFARKSIGVDIQFLKPFALLLFSATKGSGKFNFLSRSLEYDSSHSLLQNIYPFAKLPFRNDVENQKTKVSF